MKSFVGKTGGEGSDTVISFLKALAAEYALTAVVFLALAIALTYTDMSEGYIPLVSSLTTAAASFLGGIVSGRNIGSRGLFCGVLAAVFYILVMLIIGLFTRSDGSFALNSVPTVVMALGAGALGGILGVNSKN